MKKLLNTLRSDLVRWILRDIYEWLKDLPWGEWLLCWHDTIHVAYSLFLQAMQLAGL